jgi:aspartyl-tRNA(Asn)/glutamyl-tRNA(Gln) amidotransferase subunit B
MKWEVVIGLETHAQLSTVSKMFSGASTQFGAAPNSQACAVDLALPGVLPVPNVGAIERAVKFGLAIGAKINQRSVFARKNYFYPDSPKGYQISQYELPIVEGGTLTVAMPDGSEKVIQLTRAHLEEDAGKSVHENFVGVTGIDLNRCGTPLLEIVTEPVMRSAQEAVAYAKALHGLVRYLDICDGNMQEGSFRCDANVSVRPVGQAAFGTRVEIKNLNSFRFLEKSIEHEVRRQIELIEDGGKVTQETRLYDPDNDETRAMRSKEDANDYRYFPDPDLPPLVVTDELMAFTKSRLPELPAARKARYQASFGFSSYDAGLISASRENSEYFEGTLAALGPGDEKRKSKFVANWMLGTLAAALNRENLEIGKSLVSVDKLAEIIAREIDGTLSSKLAKSLFEDRWGARLKFDFREGIEPSIDDLIEEQGLKQISDAGALGGLIDDALAKSAAQVADYRAGKEKALMSIVGLVMKSSGGKANPQQVLELLKTKLA